MSWRDAPLYVEVHDLARWLLERAGGWTEQPGPQLAPPVTAAMCDLVSEVSLALTFPRSRRKHLERADELIVRLRVLLRLAGDLGVLSAGGLRFAAGRLQAAGRMVGGWRKRVEAVNLRTREVTGFSGDGPPAAAGA